MPQMAPLTLADGQTTPVNHTFSVMQAQMGDQSPASWADTSGGVYNSFKRVTAIVRRSASTKSTRVVIKITDPAIDATNVVVSQPLFSCEFVLPDSGTLQGRKDILAYAKNLLANSVMTDMVVNLQPNY